MVDELETLRELYRADEGVWLQRWQRNSLPSLSPRAGAPSGKCELRGRAGWRSFRRVRFDLSESLECQMPHSPLCALVSDVLAGEMTDIKG